MKKRSVAWMMAAAVTLLAACGSKQEQTPAGPEVQGEETETGAEEETGEEALPEVGETVRIGVTTALTGPSPLNGQRTKEGVTMAQEEINAQGGIGGVPLEIVIEDDGATTSGTMNSVNKLLSSDISALIGPHMSSNVLAVQEQLKDSRMAFLAGGSSPGLTELGNEFLFRVRPSDSLACKIAVKYLLDEVGAQKIGMIYDTDNWATSAKEVVEAELGSKNIEFICEGYNTGDKDMTGQLAKLKNAGMDALIVWGHDAEIAIIAKQIKEVGIEVPIMGSAGFAMSTVLDLIDPEVSAGILTVSEFTPYSEEEGIQEFVKKYQEKYESDPDLYSAAYYDCIYLLKDAIERAGSTDPEAIRAALAETKELKGVMSTMTASETGEMIHEMSICEVRDGKAYVIQKVYEDGYEP